MEYVGASLPLVKGAARFFLLRQGFGRALAGSPKKRQALGGWLPPWACLPLG